MGLQRAGHNLATEQQEHEERSYSASFRLYFRARSGPLLRQRYPLVVSPLWLVGARRFLASGELQESFSLQLPGNCSSSEAVFHLASGSCTCADSGENSVGPVWISEALFLGSFFFTSLSQEFKSPQPPYLLSSYFYPLSSDAGPHGMFLLRVPVVWKSPPGVKAGWSRAPRLLPSSLGSQSCASRTPVSENSCFIRLSNSWLVVSGE